MATATKAKPKTTLVPPPRQKTTVEVLLEADREAERENIQIIRSALLATTLNEPYDAADVAAALRDTKRDAHWWDGYCAIAKQYAGLRTDEEFNQLLAKASEAREAAGRDEREAQQALGRAIDKSKAARSACDVLAAERKERSQLRVWNPLICGSEEEALSAKPGPAITLQEIHSNEAHGIRPYDLNRR
jgi:hypothetical protein